VVSSKLDGVAGSTIVMATTKDLDLETSKEGKEFYVRIKDVIERINLRRNAVESAAADRFRRAISKPDIQTLSTPGRLAQRLTKNKMDLSWKDGGKRFPKKSSVVGDDFQASSIPIAGNFRDTDNRSET
jgi:hypothetical protein